MRIISNIAGMAGLVMLLASCHHYSLEGTVSAYGYEGHSLALVEFNQDGFVIHDSCVVNHGRFEMNGSVDSTRFVLLCKDGQPVIPMYMEKGKINVNITCTEMAVSGTRQNDLFYSFLKEKNAIDSRYDEMQQKSIQLAQSGTMNQKEMKEVRDSISTIISECENLIYGFVSSNYSEQAAIGVFTMLLGGAPNEVSPLINRILESAPGSFFDVPSVSEYVRRVGYSRP